MGELRLGLLGGFRLERPDGKPLVLPTKKAKALLAYLALHRGQPQARAKLAALLWEDSDEPQARESLRQTLSLLRKALSPSHSGALISQEDAVALEPAALAVDLVDFECLLASNELAELGKAAQLYRGDFLEGFDLRASEFETWIATERQRLKEKALVALEKLLNLHLADNAIESGVSVASRLLALDPLRESVHRSLMELHCKQGRHAAALRQYRICTEGLRKELGVDPDAATIALYREIRDQRHKPQSGAPYLAGAEAPKSEPAAEHGLRVGPQAFERRQMTILVCDLVGLTVLSGQREPEELHAVIAGYKRCCCEVVSRFGGTVQKFSGDGMVACFGYPEAHELDPERAVRAGLALVEAVPNSELTAPVHARIGIATGPVVVGDFAGDDAKLAPGLLGEAARTAALLQSVAEPDSVLVAANTRDLVGGLFEYQAADSVSVTGSPESMPAWRVTGESGNEIRFEAFRGTALTPFVGRDAEVEQLLEFWRQAKAGEGRIVLISGEPGIGKSRLVRAMQERLAGEPHTRLRYQCSPFHTNSVLHPFIQQLERAAGFPKEDEPGRKLDKLEAMLAMGTSRVEAVAPLFAALFSVPSEGRYAPIELTPVQQRRQTFAALLDQLEGLARRQPVLQVFEDAQWVDATSRELIDLGVERIRQLPVLLLITFRPEFEAPWVGLPNVSTLRLGRLERRHVEAIAHQVAGSRSLPFDVVEQIIFRSDGIPLFIEELTRTVLERSSRIEDADGYGLENSFPRVAIPATLHDSLMARLDRLGRAKDIAQTAAAIGREFSYTLLSAVVGQHGAALHAPLAQLEQAQLVFRKGEPPDATYIFKHALLQDIAYERLPKSRRHTLHERVAETIRDRFPTIAESQPEVVAHHFTEAGRGEVAVEWWGKAGGRALRRSAYVEAIAHLQKAISLADKLADGHTQRLLRLKLQVDYGQALIAARGYGARETAAAFACARELVATIQDPDARFSVNYGLWVGSYVRGELPSMRELAETFLHDTEALPDSREAGAAGRICGQTSWFQGDFIRARMYFEQALATYDPNRDRERAIDFHIINDPIAALKILLAPVLWALGHVAESRLLAEEAIAHVTRSSVTSMANTLSYKWWFEMMSYDPARAFRHADTLLGLSREHGLTLHLAYGAFMLGWALWHQGERESGMVGMREGVALLRNQGVYLHRPFVETLLAEAEAEIGRVAVGLAILDDQLAEIQRTGQVSMEAEMHRVRGQLLQRREVADHDAAEASFTRAIEIARIQHTKSFELRATLALAKLYHATGRDKTIPALLAPALAYFSNEVELPELHEANRLLASLAVSSPRSPRRARPGRLELST